MVDHQCALDVLVIFVKPGNTSSERSPQLNIDGFMPMIDAALPALDHIFF